MIRYNSFQDIATIFLDRPQKSHAYTTQMLFLLEEAIEKARSSAVCVLSSTGERVFCAGADRNSLQERRAEDALTLKAQSVFASIVHSPTVFIAALNGPAIAGGFELALACDLRVVHPRVYCALPEVELGLIPAAGGCTRLSEMLGSSIARSVILGGTKISAEQGMQWGLFHRMCESPQDEAISWARDIQKKNSLALQVAKQVLAEPSLQAERMAEGILYERNVDSRKK